eukprot:9236325-Pyramimonas_sp.AAC.1
MNTYFQRPALAPTRLHFHSGKCPAVGRQPFENPELCQNTTPGTSTPRITVTVALWRLRIIPESPF